MLVKRLAVLIMIIISLITVCISCKGHQDIPSESSKGHQDAPSESSEGVSQPQSKNEPINGASNAYCGYAMQSGDTVYFLRLDNRIYRMKKGEKEYTKVSDDPVHQFGVYEDYIYYRSFTSLSSLAVEEDGIYRMKTDGMEKVNIIKADVSDKFYVIDNWIYYCVWNEGFYKYNLLNSEKVLLTDEFFEMSYYNNRFYFYGYRRDAIFSVNTDGADKKTIVETEHTNVTVIDDWIYYKDTIYQDDDYKTDIYKVNIDGTNKSKIEGTEGADSLNVKGEWIYYCNGMEGSLYKVKIDGTNKTWLDDINIGFGYISVTEEWIFYASWLKDNDDRFKIRIDGTEKTKIT